MNDIQLELLLSVLRRIAEADERVVSGVERTAESARERDAKWLKGQDEGDRALLAVLERIATALEQANSLS